MAAAYGFGLCKNHPFQDGNKRAAFLAMSVFLRLNGWELEADQQEAANTIVGIADGSVSRDALVEWTLAHARSRPSQELRDFFAAVDCATLANTFSGIAAGPIDEKVATILEAGHVIPAIHAANIGSLRAEEGGDSVSAAILRHHSMLLTALYRIAEDMGYEW